MSLSSKKLLNTPKETLPVIVSLTSIPSRYNTLHLVIRGLLAQNHRPKKIVLWLNDASEGDIPKKIAEMQSEVFEVCFTPLKCPHKKLIHTLEKYPGEVVITCDDDLIYRKDWAYLLYKEHQKHPEAIIGNRTVHINFDENGLPLSYKQWNYPEDGNTNPRALMPIGAWGILYPPGSLSEQIQDVSLFMKLAPKNDDLWFKAIALVSSTLSMQAEKKAREPIPIIGSQKISLKSENVDKNRNDSQWRDLSEYFKLSTIIRNGFPINPVVKSSS